MKLIDRLILAALGLTAIYLGYNLIEVRASTMEFGPRREEVIDIGLLITAIGFGTIFLGLIPNPKKDRR